MLFSSWPCSEIINVITSPGELSAVKNLSKDCILCAGLWKHGEKDRIWLCTTLAFIAIALSGNSYSAPLIIADIVPNNNQIIAFNKNWESTPIDKEKSFAKLLIKEALSITELFGLQVMTG